MKHMSVRWMVFGCVLSRSSVGVDVPSNPNNHATRNCTQDDLHKDLCIVKKTKHPLRFRLPKASISHGIQKLIRSLKAASRMLIVYKRKEKSDDEEKDDDNDEEDDQMEIGYPTDVKHLTHIGWDGSTTTMSKPCNDLVGRDPSEIISFPSISLKQFEAAMAQQAQAAAINNNNNNNNNI